VKSRYENIQVQGVTQRSCYKTVVRAIKHYKIFATRKNVTIPVRVYNILQATIKSEKPFAKTKDYIMNSRREFLQKITGGAIACLFYLILV
jgi:hypothetical protein